MYRRQPARHERLLGGLRSPAAIFPVTGEPTVELARTGIAAAREHGADVVAAIGGGSVIDTAKAVAMLLGPGHAGQRTGAAVGAAQPPALDRYAEAARLLTGNPSASIDDGLTWIRETITLLGDHGGFLGGEYGQSGEPDAFAATLHQVLVG